MVQCPFCMSEIDPAATVCPHCQAVKQKDGWRSADQVARNGRTGMVMAIVAIALIVLIGGALWNRRQADNRADVEEQMVQIEECISTGRNCSN